MVRGELFRISAPKGARGHEQRGARFAVVLQGDALLFLSTVIVAPTSTAAQDAPWRPRIEIDGTRTCVMLDQLGVVDSQRLGQSVGRLSAEELNSIDELLPRVLGLAA